MLEDAPAQGIISHLRKSVDHTQHPAGPSFTSVGDMNLHGRASAASTRAANNNLQLSAFIHPNMTEIEMIEQAVAESHATVQCSTGTATTHLSATSSFATSSTLMPAECGIHNASDDDTPMIIVNMHKHVSNHRHKNCESMSAIERKSAVTVISALSRPCNSTYVNELNNMSDLPTVTRADELIKYAEDSL